MNYTTPNKVLTRLPKEIRESEDKDELISLIIIGYQELEIPQDKAYVEDIITTTSHKYSIPDNYKSIVSINMVYTEEDVTYFTPVYAGNIEQNICSDNRRCRGCEYVYHIKDRVITLPVKEATYEIVYDQLYSDELKIYDDPIIIKYLVSYVNREITYNRARRSDVSQSLLQYDDMVMNSLYTKARGQVLLKAIRKTNYRLALKPINLTYDEFNNRYLSN